MRRHPDGTVWIHSGDLGYMDADGFVYIKGRMKRIIIRHDGHKVFPTQLEGIIGGCGKVEACAVVAVRDREQAQGKLPMAFVKLRDSIPHERFQAIRDEILALCNAQLPLRTGCMIWPSCRSCRTRPSARSTTAGWRTTTNENTVPDIQEGETI